MTDAVNQPIRQVDIMVQPAPFSYTAGEGGVTHIEQVNRPGLHCDIPYIRVWNGPNCIAEFCQHHILGIYFFDAPGGMIEQQGDAQP